jgi:hypothetical protein
MSRFHVCFRKNSVPGDTRVICPACLSDSPRRSRRKGVKDYVIGLTMLRPWRCRICDTRFYAWAVPINYVGRAHCARCGNMDLQRISSEHGTGTFAWLFRLLNVPTYRCAPCRNRFFSFRTYRRIVPARSEPDTRTTPHSAVHQ